MNTYKLTAIAAGLIFSAGAFAGNYKETPLNLCTTTLCSQPKSGFYVGVTGMYAQPSESGLGLVTDSWQYVSDGAVNAISKPFDPDHEWEAGFKIGYDFGDSANSLEFDYFHLNNDNHAINASTDAPFSFGSVFFPDITIPDPAATGLVSDAHLRYIFSQYDLMFGHTYTDRVGNFTFKPSFGARYAKLEHRMTFAAPGAIISNFNGIGPEIAFDGHYSIGSHFGLVGHVDSSVLAGNIDSSSYIAFPPFLNSTYKLPSTKRVVPTATGKLGADAKYIFQNEMSLDLEVGYQVSEYWNSVDLIQGTAFPGAQKIIDIATDNFSYTGPYLTLTFHV